MTKIEELRGLWKELESRIRAEPPDQEVEVEFPLHNDRLGLIARPIGGDVFVSVRQGSTNFDLDDCSDDTLIAATQAARDLMDGVAKSRAARDAELDGAIDRLRQALGDTPTPGALTFQDLEVGEEFCMLGEDGWWRKCGFHSALEIPSHGMEHIITVAGDTPVARRKD